MNEGIGRLLDSLEESGQGDTTLVLVQVNDGGCHVEDGPDR